MSTRTRRPVKTEEDDFLLSDPLSGELLLDDVTDDDIEAFLEEQEGVVHQQAIDGVFKKPEQQVGVKHLAGIWNRIIHGNG